MKDVLTSGILERYARPGLLLALDYDGTLSPIVKRPERARMRRRTVALLRELSKHCILAFVSGRSRKSLRAHTAEIRAPYLVGNHGMEWSQPGPRDHVHLARVAKWYALLVAEVGDLPGIEIENKRFSLSLHYRKCRDWTHARSRIFAVIRRLRGYRIIDGKAVLNLVPHGAPDKGDAVRKLRRVSRAKAVIYLGDDVTDEDVFRLKGTPWLLGVKVGTTSTIARFRVLNQRQVDRFLAQVLASLTSTK